jgi:PEP-CTERM motif
MALKITTTQALAAGSLAAVLMFGAAARADEIGVFQASGDVADPAASTLSGTLDIDLDSGLVLSGALNVTAIGDLAPTIFQQAYSATFADYAVDDISNIIPGDYIYFGILSTTLVNYAGGFLSSEDHPSPNNYATGVGEGAAAYQLRDGALTLQSTFNTVPEPSAWALMLMGFGGLGAVLRRRRTGAAVPA